MNKILLDASTLLTPKSGIGFYVDKIAKSLINDKNLKSYFFLDHYFQENLNFENQKRNLITRILMKNINIKYNFLSSKIRNFIKKNKIDLFHQPNFITYNTDIKNISTVHDFSWYYFPNYFLKSELKMFNDYFEKSLKISAKVIVHSNFIKKDLIKLFNYPKENIQVIYEDLRRDFQVLDEKNCKDFLKKFKFSYKKFFLVLNTLEARKNHKSIINIYKKLDENIKNNYPLIISGMQGRHSKEILDLIKETKNCYYIGYLDEKYLNQCLSAAKLFFYPSVYEGFGIAPLESMASGTPVLSSDTEASKEILQTNSLNLNYENADIWISKIKEMITNQEFYNHYLNLGLEWSKKYKKGTTANNILNFYKKI